MPAISSVLVIGAGTAGTATAILLAERGVSVDLVDAKPDLSALGSGITLQGNALRVTRATCLTSLREGHGKATFLRCRAADAVSPNADALASVRSGEEATTNQHATTGRSPATSSQQE